VFKWWYVLASTRRHSYGHTSSAQLCYSLFSIWEIQFIHRFPEIDFYHRYIDDGGGIWIDDPSADSNVRWLEFQQEVQAVGLDHPFFRNNVHQRPLAWTFSTRECHPVFRNNVHQRPLAWTFSTRECHPFFRNNAHQRPLAWTFSTRECNAIFLDLNIKIEGDRITTSNIYEKELNLYLYIPPHSCHSPGVVTGLIFGAVYRANALCTNPDDRMPFIRKTYRRLLDRRHLAKDIQPLFLQAIQK